MPIIYMEEQPTDIEDCPEGITVKHEQLGLGVIIERYNPEKGVLVMFLFTAPAVYMIPESVTVVKVPTVLQAAIHQLGCGEIPEKYQKLAEY